MGTQASQQPLKEINLPILDLLFTAFHLFGIENMVSSLQNGTQTVFKWSDPHTLRRAGGQEDGQAQECLIRNQVRTGVY